MHHAGNRGLIIALAICSNSISHGQSQKPQPDAPLKLSQWISGDLMMKPGRHFSPDGRYYVLIGLTPGTSFELLFSRPSRHPHLDYTELLGAVNPGAANGLAWLPGKPHTLVFATSHGDPGYSMLALWKGGRRVHLLHKIDNDQDDEFKLFAVSRDGKSILYGWRGWTGNHFEPKVMRKRSLRLPTK